MSLISATTGLPVPGLKNATKEQKWDCSKEKMINNLKHGVAATGAVAAAGGTTYAILANENAEKAVIKVVDKAKVLVEKVAAKLGQSEGLKKIINGIKNVTKDSLLNPKTLVAITGIGIVGAIVGGLIHKSWVHTNGKIEGKHQAYTDMANGVEK